MIHRLCLILALLTAMTCSGCTEKKSPPLQPPRAELKQFVTMLEQHYQRSQPGKGWKISSLTPQGNELFITVVIPAEQASLIMRQPAEDQFRLVADQICPRKDEAIWRHLPAGSSVTVLPSVSGDVFIEVDCAH